MKRFSNKTTSYCVEVQKKKAFTLAEILLSLVVIGIVAAIALPTLLGNANERAWATQKKAILSRFSQAIPLLPSVNGYGTLTGDLTAHSGGGQTGSQPLPQSVINDTAAETFVRDGLSKVLKITNICSVTRSGTGDSTTFSSSLSDCGLPDEIETYDGEATITLSSIVNFKGFNEKFVGNGTIGDYEQLDTVAAAFETANGESMLVYYNPKCKADMLEKKGHYVQPKVCANFVYDLNGQKGPNTVGKDIGFLTVLYSSESSVVAPIPVGTKSSAIALNEAVPTCKALDDDAKLPNVEELASLFTNKNIIAKNNSTSALSGPFWSSTSAASDNWNIDFSSGYKSNGNGLSIAKVQCVKR